MLEIIKEDYRDNNTSVCIIIRGGSLHLLSGAPLAYLPPKSIKICFIRYERLPILLHTELSDVKHTAATKKKTKFSQTSTQYVHYTEISLMEY